MKTKVSALDIYYLIKEWDVLIDSKIDKVFSNNDVFLFQLHVPNIGKKYLKIMLPGSIFITEHKEAFLAPNNFCINLRKNLSGSRIRKIEQKEFERIIEFTFEKKEEKFRLYIELFSKGNIILCKQNNTIVIALKYQKWAARTIRGGVEYVYPKRDYDLLSMKEKDLVNFLESSNKNSIVVSLAKDLGLGGEYAEELCCISDIDKTLSKLNDAQTKKIYSGIKEITSHEPKGFDYDKDGVFPIKMETIKKDPEVIVSFNQVLDNKMSDLLAQKYSSKRDEKYNYELRKLNSIILQQEEQIKNFEKSIDENQEKGDYIYNNYAFIEKVLLDINKAIKDKGISELKKTSKKHNILKSIDGSSKNIVIKVD